MFHETGTVRFPFTLCFVCFKAIKKPFKLFENWFQTSLGFCLFDFLQPATDLLPRTNLLPNHEGAAYSAASLQFDELDHLHAHFIVVLSFWGPYWVLEVAYTSATLVPGKELKILASRHGCRGCCSMGDFPLERLVSSRIRQDGGELERMRGICEHPA
jgi:hypothetical protein